MLKTISSIILISSVLLACNTTPEAQRSNLRPPTPAEVEQYNAMVAPEERIICRTEVPITSRIPRRLCRLAKDVEDTSTFHREQLRQALR